MRQRDTESTVRQAGRLAGAVALALLAVAASADLVAQGRRIVDLVRMGDAKSERDHDVEGEGLRDGTLGDRRYREASGWLRATLRTYDDTEVSVACLCGGTDGRRVTFDLLVDGELAGTKTLESPASEPVVREWLVPERLTRDKGKINVTMRGVGGPTPRILELRTVQEHLE